MLTIPDLAMREAAAPAKGTTPEGTAGEVDASKKVREMFTRIAPRYDLLNHLLSMNIDRLWRARVTRRLRPILDRRDAVVLDLCCGTGDLSLGLARAGKARVIGADFAHTMLVRAKQKSLVGNRAEPSGVRMPFVEGDALRLPFASGSFDLVTTAFGFRNLANYEAGLREIYRVLKPTGSMAILEFTEPPPNLFGDLYRWYFRSVLPRIGGIISGEHAAYSYLPKSVSRFFRPQELSSLMTAVGYREVEVRVWTFGTVALHVGKK